MNNCHKYKLIAAINNNKCSNEDIDLLTKALEKYEEWISRLNSLTSTGKERVTEMVKLLNDYKDYLEVELISKLGSTFIKRQKGQMKLDNSVVEEFLEHLVNPKILQGLPENFAIDTGPQTAFMSLSFRPIGLKELNEKPDLVIKEKDQDFAIGKNIYCKFSPDSSFPSNKTSDKKLFLAVLASEVKVNLDKTMFQECAGTATRLKQGCPSAKYFVLIEYLDMMPEDSRLTDIDNVFIIRKTKRLPFEKRDKYEEVKKQHEVYPIDTDVIWNFVQEIQMFINSVWFDPDEALKRGSFV
jgi:hypothetical protein